MQADQTLFTLRQGGPMDLMVYGKQYILGPEGLAVLGGG
jgi:hypothetical protein